MKESTIDRLRLPTLGLVLAALLLCGCSSLHTTETDEPRVRVEVETTCGTFVIALCNETPVHRDNFLKLVREGYYDGLLFHRVIARFMVQTGDPDSRHAAPGTLLGEGGPDYTLPSEFALPRRFHRRGAVAAAREGDDVNPERRSSASQFYVVWGKTFDERTLAPVEQRVLEATGGQAAFTPEMRRAYRVWGGTPHLDGQYTVFGEVVKGLKVIKAIQRMDTDANDRPLKDVRILRARVVE